MEVIEFLGGNDPVHEGLALKVFPWAESHGNDVHSAAPLSVFIATTRAVVQVPELVDDWLADSCSLLLALDRLRVHDLLNELADLPLEATVTVIVVRRVISLGEPCWLCVRNSRERVCRKGLHDFGLAPDCAYLEASVLGAKEHFMTMQTKEGLGRIFTS